MSQKVNRHQIVTEVVQSNARSFFGLVQNFDLEGPGERYFSDLDDDGEDDGYELGLDGSGSGSLALIIWKNCYKMKKDHAILRKYYVLGSPKLISAQRVI